MQAAPQNTTSGGKSRGTHLTLLDNGSNYYSRTLHPQVSVHNADEFPLDFSIQSTIRSFSLRARSESDRDMWVSALEEAVRNNKQRLQESCVRSSLTISFARLEENQERASKRVFLYRASRTRRRRRQQCRPWIPTGFTAVISQDGGGWPPPRRAPSSGTGRRFGCRTSG